LRYSFNLVELADRVEKAISDVLGQGCAPPISRAA